MKELVRRIGKKEYLMMSNGKIATGEGFAEIVGFVDSPGEFNQWIEREMTETNQLKEFNRQPLSNMLETQWGTAISGTVYAKGIELVKTENHGGFVLSEELNKKVDVAWRSKDREYEEDCGWAVVAFSFPKYFTDKERRAADLVLRDCMPHEYMRVTGKVVQIHESTGLREEELEYQADPKVLQYA